ncbi:MAG TPA: hypothetical protein VJZ69_02175 [Clostridia bacterium]|nr:hypothetical protein [Clostridia bacterium]
MEFKQSTSILFSNLGLVFKLLLYVLIVTLIFVSLSSAIIIPVFRQITATESMDLLLSRTSGHIQGFLVGELSIISTYDLLVIDVKAIVNNFLSSEGTIAIVCIGMLLIYMFYKFLSALSFIPTSDILNNFMSSNLRYGFLSNYAYNMRRSLKYALWKVLISVPIDIIIVAILGGVFIGLWQIIKFLALPIIVVLGIALFSFRQAIFAGWIPRILFNPEEKTLDALKNSYRETKDTRRSLFAAFAIVNFFYWAFIGALSTATFGIMLIITPTVNYVITRIVELVSYYKLKRLRFYTDSNTVVDTVAVGMREENQEKPPKDID